MGKQHNVPLPHYKEVFMKRIYVKYAVITVYVIFKGWLLGNATHPLSPVEVKNIFYTTKS